MKNRSLLYENPLPASFNPTGNHYLDYDGDFIRGQPGWRISVLAESRTVTCLWLGHGAGGLGQATSAGRGEIACNLRALLFDVRFGFPQIH